VRDGSERSEENVGDGDDDEEEARTERYSDVSAYLDVARPSV